MIDHPLLEPALPSDQQAIRSRCAHPSGRFVEFEGGAREQAIPARFGQQVAHHRDRVAVKTGQAELPPCAPNPSAAQMPLLTALEISRQDR